VLAVERPECRKNFAASMPGFRGQAGEHRAFGSGMLLFQSGEGSR
jgi:hypothetical protein